MAITLRQLQIFLAVAQHDRIAAAAKELCVTKSAVSQALSELEERLGVNLFERAKGRLILSAEGRNFKGAADELVKRAGEVEGFFAQTGRGHLRLACTLSIGNFLLADLMRDFKSHAGWLPDISIANTAEVAESLASFGTDVALIEGPVFDNQLVTYPWLEDELVVVAPKGHPLTRSGATWRQLSEENWILREKGSSTRIFFDAQLSQRLTSPKVIASINCFETIIAMVVNGMGLTFMSKRVLDDPFCGDRLECVPCPERFHRQLNFCMHREKYLSQDMRSLVDFCRLWAQDRVAREEHRHLANATDRIFG